MLSCPPIRCGGGYYKPSPHPSLPLHQLLTLPCHLVKCFLLINQSRSSVHPLRQSTIPVLTDQYETFFKVTGLAKHMAFGSNMCGGKEGYGPRSLGAIGEGGGTPNRNSGLWLYPQLPPLLHAHAFLLFLWFLIPTYQQISNCGNSDMKVEENDTRHLCAAMIGKLQTRIPSCKFTAYFGPPESVFDYPLDKWP